MFDEEIGVMTGIAWHGMGGTLMIMWVWIGIGIGLETWWEALLDSGIGLNWIGLYIMAVYETQHAIFDMSESRLIIPIFTSSAKNKNMPLGMRY